MAKQMQILKNFLAKKQLGDIFEKLTPVLKSVLESREARDSKRINETN